MKKFKELTEAKESIVFTFGRFNPPTTGHERLIKKVASVAGLNDFRVYPSHTTNPKKDPIPQSLKIAYMRKMFKEYSKNIMASKAKTAIEIAVELYDQGYKNLTMVVGSDRVKEFDGILNKYNGVEGKRHGYYKFDDIDVVSAGERDPDAEGVGGMSASKMRAAAAAGDKDSFLKGVPSDFKDGEKLYRDVRKYMGIREEKDMGNMSDFEYIRDQYLTGKIWNVGDVVEANGLTGEVVRKGTNYLSFMSEDNKIHKVWLHEIEEDAQVRSYIDDIVNQMNSSAHKNLAPYADKFKKHAYKTLNPRKSLDAVLPSSVKEKQKANLLNMEFELDESIKVTFTRGKVVGGIKEYKSEYEAKKAIKELQRKGYEIRSVIDNKGDNITDRFVEEIEFDERNYAKEYANYQGKPEQIARRSSRNKARRVMGDKTKIGMDVGHKDNNPLNNDPKNLRNEYPFKNRREPRLRSEEENLNEMAWYTRFYNWIDTHAHKKGFDKLAKKYVDLMKSDKKYRDNPNQAIHAVAREYQGVTDRELIDYINNLVKKGVLPQELKADFDPSEAKISNFKNFIDQINNK